MEQGAPMAFEELRSRLDRLLAEARRLTDPRQAAGGLHAALVETRVALGTIREAIATTSRELDAERRQLADAQRRGGLALGVGDGETAAIAERFQARHGERVVVLERKLAVQQDELVLVERDHAELSDAYRSARLGVPPAPPPSVTDDDLGLTGGAREEELDALRGRATREQMNAAVQAQLAALKARLGRQD